MINRGGFTRLSTLGTGYVLYGVGLKANDELTHYDQKTGRSIPLFADEGELEKGLKRLDDSLKEMEVKEREMKTELAKIAKRDRDARKGLLTRISDARKASDAIKKRRDLIASFYKSKDNRQLMVNEYGALAALARNFEGQSYDLGDANSRKEFKVRLLSLLRPASLAQLEVIGQAYQQKFNRPLPITSLMRTKEYQRQLGELGNPNAVNINVPPHTTGLAFDIYTYYMNAEEQQFLMALIAQMKKDGLVEALREQRNHIHVFVFADGHPPGEALVKDSLGKVVPGASGS